MRKFNRRTASINSLSTPSRKLGLRIRWTDDGLIVAQGDKAVLLSEASEAVFRMLDGYSTLESLARTVATMYDISDEEAYADVFDLMIELNDSGFLHWDKY